MERPLGGVRAAREVIARMPHASAGTLYHFTAANLGLFPQAYFGSRATATEQRRLRIAWRTIVDYTRIRGDYA